MLVIDGRRRGRDGGRRGGDRHLVPTRPVGKPVDICGAGDSFSAGAALALSVTVDPEAAARFGNMVASITIMKKGTGTASPEEILAALLELKFPPHAAPSPKRATPATCRASAPAPPPRWLRPTLMVLAALLLMAWSSTEVADTDTWWQLKTGQYILQQHKLPAPDPFAFTT